MAIEFRPATEADLAATYWVFVAATNDLHQRHGASLISTDVIPPRSRAFRHHALAHDASSYWVAEEGGRVIGMGIGVRRESLWYLAALHIVPEYQGRGVGRTLLNLTLQSRRPGDRLSVIADAVQPVSNAMYMAAGMYPTVPIFYWEGDVGPVDQHISGMVLRTVADRAELPPIDRAVIGYERDIDHRLWQHQVGMECAVLLDGGYPVGYAYLSETGGIGPAAVVDEPLMEHLVLLCAAQQARRGTGRLRLKVPGPAPAFQRAAKVLGLRIRGSAQILLASDSVWPVGQYLISEGDALL